MTERNEAIGICGLIAIGLYMVHKASHVKATTKLGSIEWACGEPLPRRQEKKLIPLKKVEDEK